MQSTHTEWFLMYGEQTKGPFSPAELIKMKQNKLVFDYDYVWAKHLKGWTRLAHIEELKVTSESPNLNLRKHPRYQVTMDCYLSNPEYAYPGSVKSLSQGGALVLAQHPHFQVGNDVFILTKPQTELSAGFVKRGRIVSKELLPNQVQFKSSCLYIVTFNVEDPSVVKPLTDR